MNAGQLQGIREGLLLLVKRQEVVSTMTQGAYEAFTFGRTVTAGVTVYLKARDFYAKFAISGASAALAEITRSSAIDRLRSELSRRFDLNAIDQFMIALRGLAARSAEMARWQNSKEFLYGAVASTKVLCSPSP